MCVSYTMITGNVKSKHKQYDNWHSQDFFNSLRGPKRGSEATERRKGPSLVWGPLIIKYQLEKNFWEKSTKPGRICNSS